MESAIANGPCLAGTGSVARQVGKLQPKHTGAERDASQPARTRRLIHLRDTAKKNHNRRKIMKCKLFSQSHCRQLSYRHRPLDFGTIRIVPEILLPTNCNNTLFICTLFSQYFCYNGTISLTVANNLPSGQAEMQPARHRCVRARCCQPLGAGGA